jgi:hypothetical protein
MRLYAFCNFYLSSIQQGVQSLHLTSELFVKYQKPSMQREALFDWATNHKTVIVLNGGANQDILAKYLFLMREADNFNFDSPFTSFSEDDASLGGMMTCTGLVVPAAIYNAVDYKTVLSLVPKNEAIMISPSHENDYFSVTETTVGSFTITDIIESNSSTGRLISMMKSCPLAR